MRACLVRDMASLLGKRLTTANNSTRNEVDVVMRMVRLCVSVGVCACFQECGWKMLSGMRVGKLSLGDKATDALM